jgi:hypothetical protein
MRHEILIVRLLCLFGFLFVTVPGYAAVPAAQYGYINVRVLDVNDEHNFPATLRVNGVRVPRPFAHATTNFGWVALTRNNLSMSTTRTSPITVDYQFTKDLCSFQFDIWFSLFPDGRGAVLLGRFAAPDEIRLGSLPIGLRCDLDMPVCSSNPAIERQLETGFNQVRIERFNLAMSEGSKGLHDQLGQADKAVQAAAKAILDEKLPNLNAPTDLSKAQVDQSKIVADQIAEWQKQVDDAMKKQTSETSKTPEMIVQQTDAEAFETKLGAPLYGAQLDSYLRDTPGQFRLIAQELANQGDAPLDGENQLEERLQRQVNWTRSNILRSNGVAKVAKELGEFGLSVFSSKGMLDP